MTRVIHTGDTHLGYRQYHSPERRADFFAAFRAVIEDAIEDDVDAVVHAGDLFHDRTPSLADIHGVISVLRELRAADIPFLAIVGNHEQTRDQQWLDLFETLSLATRLDATPTVIGDVAFYGLDFVPRSKRAELTYDFEQPPEDIDHTALVAHGLFTPFAHADWETETVLAESSVAFDAMLLGDNHTPDTAEVDGTWVTYCGSTERADASERADRGYNIVEFDADVSIRRRGIETRPFILLDLELQPGEGIDRVQERIRQEDVEDAVVIVTLEGDGEDVPAARVEEFATDRGALIARVNDHREFEADSTPDVRFADPDDAVRERLGELGLSEAARTIDETVRSSTVADSNVRSQVKDRITDLLADDPTAFTTADDVTESGDDAAAAVSDDGTDTPTTSTTSAASDSADPDRSNHTSTDSTPTNDTPTDDGEQSIEATPARSDEDTDPDADSDGQASMEEYL
ncbi:MAG: DNA double-strand break repair protein Mre11 [Halobacteriales archaeon]